MSGAPSGMVAEVGESRAVSETTSSVVLCTNVNVAIDIDRKCTRSDMFASCWLAGCLVAWMVAFVTSSLACLACKCWRLISPPASLQLIASPLLNRSHSPSPSHPTFTSYQILSNIFVAKTWLFSNLNQHLNRYQLLSTNINQSQPPSTN